MSPEQINRKLAEWMGWKIIPEGRDSFNTPYPDLANRGHETITATNLPNYHASLDEVHEVEKKLTTPQRHIFGGFLHEMGAHGGMHPCYYAVSATAPQRCEALLKTLGLWEEVP